MARNHQADLVAKSYHEDDMVKPTSTSKVPTLYMKGYFEQPNSSGIRKSPRKRLISDENKQYVKRQRNLFRNGYDEQNNDVIVTPAPDIENNYDVPPGD